MKPQQKGLHYFPKLNSLVKYANTGSKYSKLSPERQSWHSWSCQNDTLNLSCCYGIFAFSSLQTNCGIKYEHGMCILHKCCWFSDDWVENCFIINNCHLEAYCTKLPGVAQTLYSLHHCGDDSPSFWHTISWQCLLLMAGSENQLWVRLSSPAECIHWLLCVEELEKAACPQWGCFRMWLCLIFFFFPDALHNSSVFITRGYRFRFVL